MTGRNEFTVGPWETEEKACAAFDAAASGDTRFSRLYREVEGRPLTRSPFDHDHGLRIDRILMPSKALQDAGWLHGAIGVEIKASGTKLGPVVAQAIDYTRCAFEVQPGFFMPVGFVFIFPVQIPGADLGSVMTQNRVGSCVVTPLGQLVFFRGSSRIVSVEERERNFIQLRKVGSR